DYLQIEKNRYSSENELHHWLNNICFTSQTGREAMPTRLAVLASSYHDLFAKLQSWLANQAVNHLWVNQTANDKQVVHEIADLNYERLAQLWVNGAKIPWELLYKNQQVQHISFPTYPFAQRTCWIATQPVETTETKAIDLPKQSDMTVTD